MFPSGRHDIHQLLDVEVVEATASRVVLRIPIDWKVHQPYGILHGGVSALLADPRQASVPPWRPVVTEKLWALN